MGCCRTTELCTDAAGVRIALLEDLDPFYNTIEIGQDEARDGERALCRTHGERWSCGAAKRIQLCLERLAGRDGLNGRRRLHLFLSRCWFGDREAANGYNAQQEKPLLDLHSLTSFLHKWNERHPELSAVRCASAWRRTLTPNGKFRSIRTSDDAQLPSPEQRPPSARCLCRAGGIH